MIDVLVLVCSNFEDIELISTLDILSRNQKSYHLFSVEKLSFVKGKYNAYVKTNPILDNIDIQTYKSLFLPGGPGYFKLTNSLSLGIIKQFVEKNKLVAAICAAPEILVLNNFILNRKYTSFPNVKKGMTYTNNNVEYDQNLLTGKDYLSTIDFANLLVSKL